MRPQQVPGPDVVPVLPRHRIRDGVGVLAWRLFVHDRHIGEQEGDDAHERSDDAGQKTSPRLPHGGNKPRCRRPGSEEEDEHGHDGRGQQREPGDVVGGEQEQSPQEPHQRAEGHGHPRAGGTKPPGLQREEGDRRNEIDAKELEGPGVAREAPGEREDEGADDRHEKRRPERLAHENHEADERDKTQDDDGQLQGKKRISAQGPEGGEEDLVEKETVGVAEEALRREEEGWTAPRLCTPQREKPLLVRVRDESGVPLVPHDAVESTRPLGVEEDEGTDQPRTDDDGGPTHELPCGRSVPSPGAGGRWFRHHIGCGHRRHRNGLIAGPGIGKGYSRRNAPMRVIGPIAPALAPGAGP